MKVLEMKINVDKLPDGCNVSEPSEDGCVFNCNKYCILKQALNHSDCFVQNNRGIIPTDCPLTTFK